MIEITRECDDCPDLQDVLKDIDCTLLDLSKNFHSSIIYGVETFFDQALYTRLLRWKRIITGRIYNCHYPCSLYSPNELLTIPRLLSYKKECSRCPECEEIVTTTTTTTFPPSPASCVTYFVYAELQTGTSIQYPYSYIDCEGGLVTGTISQYQALNICAIESSLSINLDIFTVLQYVGCFIVPEACKCTLLFNEETDEGVVPYVFSYSDCADNEFTNIPLDFQEGTYICVKPSTLVTNFSFTLTGTDPCTDECLSPATTTTTTTSP